MPTSVAVAQSIGTGPSAKLARRVFSLASSTWFLTSSRRTRPAPTSIGTYASDRACGGGAAQREVDRLDAARGRGLRRRGRGGRRERGRSGRRCGGRRRCGCRDVGRGTGRDGSRRGRRSDGGRSRARGLDRRHQRGDLRARERAAEVRHRPARLEHDGRVLVHVVEQEDAAAERRDQLLERRAIEPALPGRALEPVEHPLLVLVGLQPADQPRAGVREALVVEVDRVLGRQQHAHAERARLLEQRQQRLLRRRARRRAGSSRRSRPCRRARAGCSCPTARASRRARRSAAA